MEADCLRQTFVGVVECPEQEFSYLAGKRLFWVKYSDLEVHDVETVRQELEHSLRYGYIPSSSSNLAVPPALLSIDAYDAYFSSLAWSTTTGTNERATFYPKGYEMNQLRELLPSSIHQFHDTVAVVNQDCDPAPSLGERYEDDYTPQYNYIWKGSDADESNREDLN